jgi:hypothetical protein
MKSALILLFLFAMAAADLAPLTAAGQQSVLTYHANPGRSGNFVVPALTFERARALHRDQEFQGRITGQVYAQPLYWRARGANSGMLLVATEENTVYARLF